MEIITIEQGIIIVLVSVVFEFILLLVIPRLGLFGKELALGLAGLAILACFSAASYSLYLLYRTKMDNAILAVLFPILQGALFTFLTARTLFPLAIAIQNDIGPRLWRAALLILLLASYTAGSTYLVTQPYATEIRGAIIITAAQVLAVLILAPLTTNIIDSDPRNISRERYLKESRRKLRDMHKEIDQNPQNLGDE